MSLPNALFHLFDGLPRLAPGSDASTRRALGMVPGVAPNARVLDLGCGTGRQSLLLAREFGCRVTAVDLHQPYLDSLRAAAAKAGLSERIATVCMSMDQADVPTDAFDLIWSEGAVYNIGLDRALRAWFRLLRAGGALAFTECSWLTEARPAETVAFWRDTYPAMKDVGANCEAARLAGFDVIATFPLPASDWWDEFYTPLERRIAQLESAASDWPELASAIEEAKREISVYRCFEETYGYVFYVLVKPARPAE